MKQKPGLLLLPFVFLYFFRTRLASCTCFHSVVFSRSHPIRPVLGILRAGAARGRSPSSAAVSWFRAHSLSPPRVPRARPAPGSWRASLQRAGAFRPHTHPRSRLHDFGFVHSARPLETSSRRFCSNLEPLPLVEQDQTRSFLGASRTPPVRQYVQARGGTLDGHVARFDGGQLPVRAPGFTRRPRCVFDAPPAHH